MVCSLAILVDCKLKSWKQVTFNMIECITLTAIVLAIQLLQHNKCIIPYFKINSHAMLILLGLTSIGLWETQLMSIDKLAFNKSNSLVELLIVNHILTDLEFLTKAALPSLQILVLKNNSIKTMKAEMIEQLPSLVCKYFIINCKTENFYVAASVPLFDGLT